MEETKMDKSKEEIKPELMKQFQGFFVDMIRLEIGEEYTFPYEQGDFVFKRIK